MGIIKYLVELTVLPNSIDVIDFAKARIGEIQALKKDIKDAKYRGARRVFQTLPKSMRRRAASHNIKRLPTRLRLKALEEIEKDPASVQKSIKKPSCRRRNRRTKNIQEMSEKRQNDKKWLETHIWHAKRAKMANLWGYRLALHPNEKCLKSSYAASRQGTFIHDGSYHLVYEFSGERLLDFVKHMNLTEGCSEIYLESSGKLICPVVSILCQGEHLLWIFHPSAHQQAIAEIERIIAPFQISLRKLDASIFHFMGLNRFSTLSTVLQQPIKEVEDQCVLDLSVEDPRFNFPPTTSCDFTQKNTIKPVSFWNEQDRTSSNTGKSDKELNDLRSKNIIPGTKLVPTEDDPSVPVLLYTLENSTFLMMPKGWARYFWRSFIYAGARFGGLEQVKRNLQEGGTAVFPYDFPGTGAYKNWADMVEVQLKTVFDSKPKGKRVNYEKLSVNSPFKPDFSSNSAVISSSQLKQILTSPNQPSIQDNLVQGQVILLEKGCPEYNSFIFDAEGTQVIGYMTAGFQSLSKGKGSGIGSCYLGSIRPFIPDPAPSSTTIRVNIRNINSKELRPAHFIVKH